MSKMSQSQKSFTFISLVCLVATLSSIKSASCSGVFEINFSSLVDAFGRDLRDDCCSWQNQSMQQQQAAAYMHRKQAVPSAAAAEQADSCDPKKCQLIVRICVKNYQSQEIEASQCTFGELTAQVNPSNNNNNNQQQQQNHQFHSMQQHHNYPYQHYQNLDSFQGRQTINTASNRFDVHYQKLHNQQHQRSNNIQVNQQPLAKPQLALASSQARALRQISFRQSISFPFNFTWPGSYSLVVDAWYESPTGLQQVAMPAAPAASANQAHHAHTMTHHHQHTFNNHQVHIQETRANYHQPPVTMFDLYRRQLIIHHSIRGWLPVKEEWTNELHKTELATLAYSYRVTCQQNYFGEHCNLLCRPRDDIYGHYTCSQAGSVQCLPGWQGPYCLEPICLAGCHRDQGNCSRPNECNCRYGWQGATCDQCITHPGCVHGFCNKPHECICHKGWTGALCNEDESICSNKQPCQNGATCLNSIDAEGKSSYTCNCAPGFSGKNCERRTQQHQLQQQDSKAISNQSNQNSIPQLANSQAANSNLSTSASQQQQQQQAAARMRQRNLSQQQQQALLSQQQQQAGDTPGPFYPQPITLSAQQQTLERWLPEAYMVIIVSLAILICLLFVRRVLEGPNAMLRHYGAWWADWADGPQAAIAGGRGGVQVVGQGVEDVATLQNHQNIYKSRGSLAGRSTEKIAYGDSLDGSTSSITGGFDASLADRSLPRPPHHYRSVQQMYAGSHHNSPQYASRHLLHHQSYHNLAQPPMTRGGGIGAASTTNLAACPPPPYQSIVSSASTASSSASNNNNISKHQASNYGPTINYSTYGTHSLYGIPATQYGAMPASAGRRALSQARLYGINPATTSQQDSSNNNRNSTNQQQQPTIYATASTNTLQAGQAGQATYQSPCYVIAYHYQ